MLKRGFDIIASAIALVVLAPLLIVVAILVWRHLGTPVIFSQVRTGRRGRPFLIRKFRTMTEDRDASGDLVGDEGRLTSLGGFFRSTSIDELPELWNVLTGDMTLVGPRPLLVEYLARYSTEQFRRHELRPGITGWAQVNGRNSITWDDKFALDIWYIDNRTFWLDLRILYRSVKKVLRRDGISHSGDVTMPKFRGSNR